jgi:hypothetical protein
MTGARQTIAVIIIFRKPNENFLEHQAVALSVKQEKKLHTYLLHGAESFLRS